MDNPSCILCPSLCSEEDMTTVKAALYFLEVIVKHAANNQDFFKFATKIFLVSASRVQSCFKEVKDNATKKLTDIVKKASQKICHIGIFNVQVVSQRKHEIQVCTQIFISKWKLWISLLVLE